ncbi:Lsr2 family DNA-binding protein [Streptomyces roseicoloratus]|uniref:Histone-like nucleoid-structuring protein Lsr2 n=1 Tax=Streptomyces roseicoloratus TaxID=2508722 RepID=A0ABY9S2L8_9ACTN|nr:histone-like nucleoid-structuring protein Lsr2 [Streptomyces roseicoloratus]WMX48678.1 histone-like nucleoid-structuring protein Lsr2 [Streptomyces roseicoloratus]
MSTNEIRAWARANGYDVPDRGRVSATVIDAWKLANY